MDQFDLADALNHTAALVGCLTYAIEGFAGRQNEPLSRLSYLVETQLRELENQFRELEPAPRSPDNGSTSPNGEAQNLPVGELTQEQITQWVLSQNDFPALESVITTASRQIMRLTSRATSKQPE